MTRLNEIREQLGNGRVELADAHYLLALVDRLCAQIAGVDRREREGTRKDAR